MSGRSITLVLSDEKTDNIRIPMDMDDLNTAAIIQYKGNYYTYQYFKYMQSEIWFQRVGMPLVLDDIRPPVQEEPR